MSLSIYQTSSNQNQFYNISLATAYSSLLLISATLLIGPIRILQKKPPQVSSDLRRDTGFWAGVHSLIHLITGSSIMGLFVDRSDSFRFNLFTWSIYIGFGAVPILLLLLLLSNDWSLKQMKPLKWKGLQRSNYLLFFLVILHGIFFIIVEKQAWPYILLFGLAIIPVFFFQRAGFLARRRLPGR